MKREDMNQPLPRPLPAGARTDETSAHRAHFDGHDAGAALELWDAYLRRFPRGRWVPEARYNRALCLLRLHRDAEARPSLEAFARGDYGAYRQVEARRLLVAIDAGP